MLFAIHICFIIWGKSGYTEIYYLTYLSYVVGVNTSLSFEVGVDTMTFNISCFQFKIHLNIKILVFKI